jgi:hypothetical protein
VNVTLAVPFPAVAVPIVGAVGTPLVDPEAEVKIGMRRFYLTYL